jgi:hypothetical protein
MDQKYPTGPRVSIRIAFSEKEFEIRPVAALVVSKECSELGIGNIGMDIQSVEVITEFNTLIEKRTVYFLKNWTSLDRRSSRLIYRGNLVVPAYGTPTY